MSSPLTNIERQQKDNADRLRRLGLRQGDRASVVYPGYFGAGYKILGGFTESFGIFPYAIDPKSPAYGGGIEWEHSFSSAYQGPGFLNDNYRMAVSFHTEYPSDLLVSFVGPSGTFSVVPSGTGGLPAAHDPKTFILGGTDGYVGHAAHIGLTGEDITTDPGGIGGWGKSGKLSHPDWAGAVGDDLPFKVPREFTYVYNFGYTQSFKDWWEAVHQTDPDTGLPIPEPTPPDDPGDYWPPAIDIYHLSVRFGQDAGEHLTNGFSSEVPLLEPVWQSPGFEVEQIGNTSFTGVGSRISFPENGGGWYKFIAGGNLHLLGEAFNVGDFSGEELFLSVEYGDEFSSTVRTKAINVNTGVSLSGSPSEALTGAGQITGMFWVPDHGPDEFVRAAFVANPRSKLDVGSTPYAGEFISQTGIPTDMVYETAYLHTWRLFRDGTE